MSLRDYLQILRRRKWLVLAVIVAITAVAVVYSLNQKPAYRATADVLLSQENVAATLSGAPDATAAQDPGRYVSTQAELAGVPAVARAAIRLADVPISLDSFRSNSSVTSAPDADLLAFQVEQGNPQRTQRLVNAYARAFTQYREALDTRSLRRAERDITERLQTLAASGEQDSALYRRLVAKEEQLRVSQALQTSHAIVVRTADDATKTRPQPVRNGILAFVLALILGVGLAFVRDALSDREDLEESFGLPVLGTIPDSTALASGGRSAELPPLESEAFGMLRGRLRSFDGDRKVNSVLITSGVAGDGKSTVAWNLALTAASVGSKTILLECDFHQPSLATRRGLRDMPGLSELLSGATDVVVQQVPVANSSNGDEADRYLDVVVAGTKPRNPLELMESNQMASLVERLTTNEYDLVVIDTPPVTMVSDVIPLLRLVSGVIVVGEPGRTKPDAAAALREQLESLDAPVLGVVANKVKTHSGYRYGYGYRDRLAGLRIGDRS